MSWPLIQLDVLEPCKALLTAHGFKLVKSRMSFEKPSADGRLVVRVLFVASDVGNYSVQIGCGIRHDAIERIVEAGVAPERRQSTATTIQAEWSRTWGLNTAEEQQEAITELLRYLHEVALPFLEREYSLADYSALLNQTDADGNPVEQLGMGVHFWQRGLAAARLAGDPRFESLRRHYTERLRALSNGLYLPAFEKCLRYLDEALV